MYSMGLVEHDIGNNINNIESKELSTLNALINAFTATRPYTLADVKVVTSVQNLILEKIEKIIRKV